ncbi:MULTISPECIES: carbohydrate ABC transporter permease [unclassified Mesorhizobium]|uniref:carbohydrate ABC transporter permease n=1 Tax=unclassified Mesorhizobium TaxID=325217 RepID=UPI00086DC5B5|nr:MULTISPECIES: carbohydrate ABC transporter permease [unclassified Mesorhizobium]MBN9255034.1 carbohydrate ABC transporter permease [Mesorhizobium sp.]ODT19683.1 MAG: ABC transporter permease [Mesorhizobium sp. SCN 65-12]OJX76062.1 MAG: ABC transporter permease [Mesorhizobium sp. 65-26]
MRGSLRSRTIKWTLHYAVLLIYVVAALFPLYWLVKVSITPNDILYKQGTDLLPSRFSLEHYATVVGKSDFLLFFRNSIIVSGVTAIASTLLATASGYAFSRFVFRGKFWIVGLMLVTQMFPLVIVITPIFSIFGVLGLTNSLTGLIIIYTAFNIPFATFLMQSFFDGIPKELEEAAMIDGATRFKALVQIVAPLTLPGIVATVGFCFTGAWGEILFALLLNSSASTSTFPVGLLLYSTRATVEFGPMMAAGVLALLPVCVFFFLIQRYLVQGLTAGAVKG